ncbi:MAG: hypothetical protein EA355_13205 [Rhodobacteraceae bacterium]|nr:MAG: hypothetical protein EA355_13205 [Paracoccaceae bacterium]
MGMQPPSVLHDVFAALGLWFPLLLYALLLLGLGGVIGRGVGVANLFRDDSRLLDPPAGRSRLRVLWASSAFWTHVGLTLFFGLIWLTMHHGAVGPAEPGVRCDPSCLWPRDDAAATEAMTRMLVAAALAGALGLWLATVEFRRLRVGGRALRREVYTREMRRRVGGLVVGLAALGLAYQGARMATAASGLAGSELFWINAFAVILVLASLYTKKALTCLSILGAPVILTIAVGWLNRLDGGEAAMLALLLAIWVVVANGDRFKLRLPGFADAAYAAPVDPNDTSAPLPGHPAPIRITDPLDGWLAAARPKDDPTFRPKLVILATSGGAYRASFWTALLLDHLAAESGPDGAFPGLARNIRLVTGASGGMVAGAYFAAMAAEHPMALGGVRARIEADLEAWQSARDGLGRVIPIPRDSLTPIVQQMVRKDMVSVFLPFRPAFDRGRALDCQWRTLQRSFADVRAAEAEGRAPSLIISPMLVESGAPAFLSNLDLKPLRERTLPEGADKALVNRESVELFDAFPEAHATLSLATAVRLNATFPYVSPAVSLPTRPTRRVVDAGYYDNYGMDLATGWLMTPAVQDWILKHCSGVAVIQCRAFPTDRADEPRSRAARAYRWLTSPVEGLFAARGSSQMFRNNEAMRSVERAYGARLGRAGFVRSFVFENTAEASMSWYLPEDELITMEHLLPSATRRDKAERSESAASDAVAGAPEAVLLEACKERIDRELAALKAFWNA